MAPIEFTLPDRLIRLIATGWWPVSLNAQNLNPVVDAAMVRRFAAEEEFICLYTPPFHTIAQERHDGGSGDFWETHGALLQIVPEKALIIGDFGLGSDAPIVLDYSRDANDPAVARLRWGPNKVNEWVVGARNFDEFADLIGLPA